VRVRTAILREMGATPPYADSRPLSVEEVELDPPGRGELLVKVGAAGLCHSDLSVIDGSRPRVMPMALGHEAAGEVVEVGEDVTGFAPGDHVVLAFVPACGRCEPCVAGRAALCEPGAAANAAGTLLSGERRLHHPDLDVLHHHLGVSAFSDHIVVSEASAVRVDPALPYELAALFGCAVLTGVGAAVNAARIEPGQRVAVLGLGGVGLSALLGAVLQGAGTIVAVDVVPEKLALALELGATHAVAAGPDDRWPARPEPGAEHPGREPRRRGADAARVLPGLERALPGPAEVHRPAQPGQAAGRAAAHPQAQPRRGERGLRPPGRRRCRAPGDRLRLSPLTHLRGLRELVA
jgi:Zn-dependent alcohol dehydrogenase